MGIAVPLFHMKAAQGILRHTADKCQLGIGPGLVAKHRRGWVHDPGNQRRAPDPVPQAEWVQGQHNGGGPAQQRGINRVPGQLRAVSGVLPGVQHPQQQEYAEHHQHGPAGQRHVVQQHDGYAGGGRPSVPFFHGEKQHGAGKAQHQAGQRILPGGRHGLPAPDIVGIAAHGRAAVIEIVQQIVGKGAQGDHRKKPIGLPLDHIPAGRIRRGVCVVCDEVDPHQIKAEGCEPPDNGQQSASVAADGHQGAQQQINDGGLVHLQAAL